MTTPPVPTQSHQAMPHAPHQPQHAGLVPSGVSGGGVKMVAGYALQQRLGSGSFATVYKGVKIIDPQGRTETVAIKAITRTSEKLTKKVLENLDVEISILRTYRHPNIVCLHDVQKTERHFYLILEYCAGGDLQRLIRTRKSGRLSERLTRRLMRDLSAGLKFLWGHEFIHRDIKPQNLLLTGILPLDERNDPSRTESEEDERRTVNFPSAQFALKIADFGFARHLQTTSLAETLCGSPLYMAPEILQHHRYDAKADLWSVGTVLFEMIAGRPPFNGENHIDLLRNIQRKAVRLPPDVRVSKECVTLLRLLLNRNPLSRAGFKEFFEASDAFVALGCEGEPIAQSDSGAINLPKPNLGPIAEMVESNAPGAASLATVATFATMQNPAALQKPITRQDQRTDAHDRRDSERNTPSSSPPDSGVAGYAAAGSTTTRQNHPTNLVSPPTGPLQAPASERVTQLIPSAQAGTLQGQPQQLAQGQRRNSHFKPLEPSPPGPTTYNTMMPPPPLALGRAGGVAYVQHQTGHRGMVVPFHQAQRDQHQQQTQEKQRRSDSSNSSDESGFVMVEHSGSLTPTGSQTERLHGQVPSQLPQHHPYKQPGTNQVYSNRSTRTPLQSPISPGGSHPTTARRSSSFKNLTKGMGMLSTSPGTGGLLVGMMGNLATGQKNVGTMVPAVNKFDTVGAPQPGGRSNIELATKMLAAAEDVGRRAVAVAHLGDTRAFVAMRSLLNSEGGSSLLSSSPMEGVVEEDEESTSSDVQGSDGTSSSSTRVAGRMRAVSADRSMERCIPEASPEDEEDDDEMPFATNSQVEEDNELTLPPVPMRPGSAAVSVSGSITSPKQRGQNSPLVVQLHFREALSCYLKALSMIKGSINATQRVMSELGSNQNMRPTDLNAVISLKKRCEVSQSWLSGQFAGVLERADAAKSELAKLQSSLPQQTGDGDVAAISPGALSVLTVEELIYNHSLTCGRDGAVKQLLGQHEAARSCYRSAGLLAETLLMEPKMVEDDRRVLEEYVHGFAERITEVDSVMMHQSRNSVGSGSAAGSRRNSGVVGLVGGMPPANLPLTS
uniref:Protein kinase domain-containing protein n=1 Tax=Odontella aurita TaxID=265563 RepID=A0A6U6DJ44_9STRA|mmetsp:Transcript_20761/g.60396  ORF Transcript_20761/g.60396 Transcript_20761/m.60396 type:complete len:1066 (+) Transcript_20761:219-3416(+)|eukprot:CAMPEP_0113600136 /NCGR_PEP_ID=MMETSP0015_2-20120614/42543_1 /TAXON_ID=2838 /ORGANISM="Odontella" /LENGTH=1065 /DNA_ID=CAMNT_0000508367 /DNA_START=174 /DNA_END=3371 /DNA_ORIENTATION=+ /assembly_acc=CAM_ASM_000160